MKQRFLFSFLTAIAVSTGLVFTITDMENNYVNIYNFTVFMFLYFSGTIGFMAIVYLGFLIRKKKLAKEEITKEMYYGSVVMIIVLLAMGFYFYDWAVPREFEGDEYVYHYNQPIDLNDGLQVGNISNTGISSDTLKNIVKKIVEDKRYKGITSFLLWNKNKLVAEEYFYNVKPDTPQDIRSATKSITSLLVGVAIDNGFIKSETEKISKFLPEYFDIKDSTNVKAQITIKDLLDMNSCLDCNDWQKESPGKEDKIYRTHNWVETVLKLGTFRKDSTARYCTGGVIVLGEIVARASGIKFDEFAEKYLFAPLGINSFNWRYMPSGGIDSGGHLNIRARDLLKIAILVLNNGIWNNKQVISAEWISKIRKNNITMPEKELDNPGYGYLWWKIPFGYNTYGLQALGNGGNLVFIFPELDSVILFTGINYNKKRMIRPIEITKKNLLPALINN